MSNNKSLQLMVDDEKIDNIVKSLLLMKTDNNKVVRITGNEGAPQLIVVHKNFKRKNADNNNIEEGS